MMEQLEFIAQAFQLFPIEFFKNSFSAIFDQATLRQLPQEAYLAWLAFFMLIALVSLYQNYRNLLKARTIEDTPSSKIRSTAQGYAEVSGKQYPLPNLQIIAPLTVIPCTWYRYQIYKKNQKNAWFLISQGESSEHFMIKDPTGFCVVDPLGADIHPTSHDTWYGFSSNPQGKSKYKIMLILGFIFGGYQYKEARMEIDSDIYALGNFTTIRAGEAALTQQSLEKQADLLVKKWGKDYDSLIAKFDLNKDGILSPEEKLIIQQAAESEIREKYSAQKQDAVINVLSKKGLTGRQPYLISNITQKQLARKYRFYSTLWLILFMIFMPYSFWWLTIKF